MPSHLPAPSSDLGPTFTQACSIPLCLDCITSDRRSAEETLWLQPLIQASPLHLAQPLLACLHSQGAHHPTRQPVPHSDSSTHKFSRQSQNLLPSSNCPFSGNDFSARDFPMSGIPQTLGTPLKGLQLLLQECSPELHPEHPCRMVQLLPTGTHRTLPTPGSVRQKILDVPQT